MNIYRDSHLFKFIIDRFEKENIPYCITHGYERLHNQIDSDVDIIIPHKYLSDLRRYLPDVNLIQCLQHESTAFYMIFTTAQTPEGFPILHLDASSDFRRDGLTLISSEEFIRSRVRWEKQLWIPSPAVEYIYLILKMAGKGEINNYHIAKIKMLYLQEPEYCREKLYNYFNRELTNKIITASSTGSWDVDFLDCIKNSVYQNKPVEKVVNKVLFKTNDWIRIMKRSVHPTGLFIVFLGIDGSGKTTIIRNIQSDLGLLFRGIKTGHFKPGLIFKSKDASKKVISSPHQQQPYPPVLSALKVLTIWLDWLTGTILRIIPWRIKSNLILWDRHFLDMIMDPKRYRVDLPSWCIKVMDSLIQKPDLVFILDTSPEVALLRKSEVPLPELAELDKKYRQLSGDNVRHINSDQPIEIVAFDIKKIVMEFMECRLK